MIATAPDRLIRVSTARTSVWMRLRDLWRYRELLIALTRTELKVKYKNSVLGFFWSMANPALYLVVFYVVFELILDSGIPNFPIFLLSGLLMWNLFLTGLSGATGSVVGSASLVKKVAFPREILPLASVGAALVHFFLQTSVLAAALVIFQYPVGFEYFWLLPIALAVLVLVTAAMGLFLAAANVHLRDTEHFVTLALIAWFWITPIVYQYRLVADKGGLAAFVYNLNPVTWVVVAFQRAIYNKAEPLKEGAKTATKILPADAGAGWYAWHLGGVALAAALLFLVGLWLFGRLEGNFAEDL